MADQSRRRFLQSCALAPALFCPTLRASGGRFDLSRDDIHSFAVTVAQRNAMDAGEILALLAQAAPQSTILDAMGRPAEKVLPWWQYRTRFLDNRHIEEGARLWDAHAELLEQLQQRYAVPAQYLLAIVGVETAYGRITGHYRVLDSLATLAFDYAPRAEYFRQELEQLLLMVREHQVDPLSVRGSYAGAMGAPQFMPSSYRLYGVDAMDKGRCDLWHDWHDILASVARYFVEHGWRPGEPVLAIAEGENPADDPEAFTLGGTETLASIRARGYTVASELPDDAPALLVPAEEPSQVNWRVGFNNFLVITRYNRSPRYAMAVHDLAQALRDQHDASGETPT